MKYMVVCVCVCVCVCACVGGESYPLFISDVAFCSSSLRTWRTMIKQERYTCTCSSSCNDQTSFTSNEVPLSVSSNSVTLWPFSSSSRCAEDSSTYIVHACTCTIYMYGSTGIIRTAQILHRINYNTCTLYMHTCTCVHVRRTKAIKLAEFNIHVHVQAKASTLYLNLTKHLNLING